MGQFKPMVKMMTTEPTVELKLKKGGKVEKKMQMGGAPVMGGLPARGGDMPAAAPARPDMMKRRRMMKAMGSGPAAPVGRAATMMKEGGEAHEDAAEDRAMIKKALAGKKYKTGGVVMGQGGFKHGGKVYAKGGGVEGNVSTTPAGVSGTKTGEVVKGQGGYKTGGVANANGGGYKKGGATKKFADGGSVQDDGRPVKMPQGSKRPPAPVRITALSGTYRKGGKVKKMAGGGTPSSENEPLHASAAESKAYKKYYEDEKAENEATREQFMKAITHPIETMKKLPGKIKEGISALRGKPGSVTKTEESVTVTPGKKRGGSVC